MYFNLQQDWQWIQYNSTCFFLADVRYVSFSPSVYTYGPLWAADLSEYVYLFNKCLSKNNVVKLFNSISYTRSLHNSEFTYLFNRGVDPGGGGGGAVPPEWKYLGGGKHIVPPPPPNNFDNSKNSCVMQEYVLKPLSCTTKPLNLT